MKSTERHKLKENEFARSVARAREMVSTRGSDIARVAVIAVVVIAAGRRLHAGGGSRATRRRTPRWRRRSRCSRRRSIAPTAPAPGSPMPVQQPGTFQTEQAKLEAALPKLMEAADEYPKHRRRHRGALLRRVARSPRSAASRKRSSATRKSSTRPAAAIYGRTGAARARRRAGRAGQVRQRDRRSTGS